MRSRAKTSPFAGAAARERGIVWVKPELVAEVEFRAWTASKTLRHASFLGLREDKPAEEVVAEAAGAVETRTPSQRKPPQASRPRRRPRRPRPAPKGSAARETTQVKLSSPDKPLWPRYRPDQAGICSTITPTVWPLMQPFVVDRPLSLVRAPNGIEGHRFFQKHAMPGMHDAVKRQKDKDGEELLFIEISTGWRRSCSSEPSRSMSGARRWTRVETPDQIIFDLDPDPGVPLERVRDGGHDGRATVCRNSASRACSRPPAARATMS